MVVLPLARVQYTWTGDPLPLTERRPFLVDSPSDTPRSLLRRRYFSCLGIELCSAKIKSRIEISQSDQSAARTHGNASQSKVNVSVQQGNVTLTGTLQHAIQRSPIVKAISQVTGVRRVVDQMQHTVKKAPRPDVRQNVHLPEPDDSGRVGERDCDRGRAGRPSADEPADEQPRPE